MSKMCQETIKTKVPESIIADYRQKAEIAVKMAATLYVIFDVGENYVVLETAYMDGSRVIHRYACD